MTIKRKFLSLYVILSLIIIFVQILGITYAKDDVVEGIEHFDTFVTDYGIFKKPICYENGAVELRIIPTSKNNVQLDKFIKGVGAIMPGTNFSVNLKRYWYDKEGYWLDENYKPFVSADKGEPAIFISDEYLLNKKGNYSIIISGIPYEILHLVNNAKKYELNFSCPGYHHSCKIKPKIKECFSQGDYFYLYITGLNYENFSKIDLSRDIDYELNYQTYKDLSSGGTPMPNTTKYKIQDNEGMVIIPLKDLKDPVSSVKIHVKGCIDEYHNTTAYDSCDFRKEKKEEVKIEKVNQKKKYLNLTPYEQFDEGIGKEKESPVKIEEKTLYHKMLIQFYDFIPVKEGALKNFLINLGKP